MSKERELLTKALNFINPPFTCMADQIACYKLVEEIEELLAQPEPEPIAWMNDDYEFCVNKEKNDGYPTSLYTEAPKTLTPRQGYAKAEIDLKRKPLSDERITEGHSKVNMSFAFDRGFEAGVKFAEKEHGIGE